VVGATQPALFALARVAYSKLTKTNCVAAQVWPRQVNISEGSKETRWSCPRTLSSPFLHSLLPRTSSFDSLYNSCIC
jgi:hypothetical protein